MSKSNWEERFREADMAFQKLKSMTKKVPASTWTPEYGELAELIHSTGRDVFYLNRDDYEDGL